MRPPPRRRRAFAPAAVALTATFALALTLAPAAAAAPLAVPLTAARARPRALAAGGAALPLGGGVREAGYYTAALALGTPPTPFDLVIDTGSTFTYVPCAGCGPGCGPHHQKGYDVAASSTGARVGCGDPACVCGGAGRPCGCSKGGECLFSREYAEQSSVGGRVVSDVVRLPPPLPAGRAATDDDDDDEHASSSSSSSSSPPARPPPARLTLGCTTHESGELFAQVAAGVAGLGDAATGVPRQLAAAKAIDGAVLALCLAPDAGSSSSDAPPQHHGALLLGRGAHAAHARALRGPTVTTPLVPSPGHPHYYAVAVASMTLGDGDDAVDLAGADGAGVWGEGAGVAIDSGATLSYLPPRPAAAFAAAVAAAAEEAGFEATPPPPSGLGDACWRGAGDPSAALPSWTLTFASPGSPSLVLPPSHYTFPHATTADAFCLGVAPAPEGRGSLVGAVALRGLLVELDADARAFTAARADCGALGAVAAAVAAAAEAEAAAERPSSRPRLPFVVAAGVGVAAVAGAVALTTVAVRRRRRRGESLDGGKREVHRVAPSEEEAVCATLPAGAAGVPAVAAALGTTPAGLGADGTSAAALGVEAASLAAVAAVVAAGAARDPRGVPPLPSPSLDAPATACGVVGGASALAALTVLAPADSGATDAAAALLASASPAGDAALIAASCVAAPLLEETVYRGILLAALLDAGAPPPVAIAAAALAFAASHALVAPGDVAPLAVLGSVLGATYCASGRRLGAAILAHGLYNGAVLAASARGG